MPRHTDVATYDDRRLGIPVRALHIVGGCEAGRAVPLDDASLLSGFHAAQTWDGEQWRWTDGEGVLSPVLWADCQGDVSLILHLAPERGTLRAWQPPDPEAPANVLAA